MSLFEPTYGQIIDKINAENGRETIESRYSVVLAAAKRARQLIDGDEPLIAVDDDAKPLTVAVEEIYGGEVLINARDEE